MQEQLQKLIDDVLRPELEVLVKKEINEQSDKLIDELAKLVEEKIPASAIVIEPLLPVLKEKAKEILLAQAEKISDKV